MSEIQERAGFSQYVVQAMCLRVIRVILTAGRSLPVYPDKQTFSVFVGMSQTVESRMGAVAWAIRQRSVSHPRSSNRTCPIKASGLYGAFFVKGASRHFGRPLHSILLF